MQELQDRSGGMLIINCIPGHRGWSPIAHMLSLAARLLDAQVLDLHTTHPTLLQKMLAVLLRRQRSSASDLDCLFVCPSPADLPKITLVRDWRSRFRTLGAWIIDSFWYDHLSSVTRLADPFDCYFVTLPDDVPVWRHATGRPVIHVPWGTDALGLGGADADRPLDLLRCGRQPPEWDDDAVVGAEARGYGIRFQGRPEAPGLSALENQAFMMRLYRRTRFSLAFSNLAHPQHYTHPDKDYLTGRWVDALACGATVAGIHPRGADADEMLWEGATLELGSVSREAGLQQLASAIRSWTPAMAARNHWMALQRLDWRWRLHRIADALSASTPAPLATEIKALEARIAALAPEAGQAPATRCAGLA